MYYTTSIVLFGGKLLWRVWASFVPTLRTLINNTRYLDVMLCLYGSGSCTYRTVDSKTGKETKRTKIRNNKTVRYLNIDSNKLKKTTSLHLRVPIFYNLKNLFDENFLNQSMVVFRLRTLLCRHALYFVTTKQILYI